MQMLETTFFFLFFLPHLSLVLHVSLRSSVVYTAVMRDGGVRVCQGQCELVNWSLTARPSFGTLQQAIGVSLTFMR